MSPFALQLKKCLDAGDVIALSDCLRHLGPDPIHHHPAVDGPGTPTSCLVANLMARALRDSGSPALSISAQAWSLLAHRALVKGFSPHHLTVAPATGVSEHAGGHLASVLRARTTAGTVWPAQWEMACAFTHVLMVHGLRLEEGCGPNAFGPSWRSRLAEFEPLARHLAARDVALLSEALPRSESEPARRRL